MPKPMPEDILIRIEAINRGPEAAPLASAADPLVSQHLVVGTRRAQDQASSQIDVGARSRRSSSITTITAIAGSSAKASPESAVHRKRNQFSDALRTARMRIALCQRRHQRLRRARRQDGGQSRTSTARKPRRITTSTVAAGRNRDRAVAADRSSRRRDVRYFDGTFDSQIATAAQPKRMSFIERSFPTESQRGRQERHAPGVRRIAVEQAVLSLRCRTAGCKGDPADPSHRANG